MKNPANGGYYLTDNPRDVAGYANLGPIGYIAMTPGASEMTKPLFRLWNGTNHLFTADQAERDQCLNNGWTQQSVVGFVVGDSSEAYIPSGTSWIGEMPSTSTLEISEARIDNPTVAGAAYSMQVWVNDQIVSSPLLNKGALATWGDNRQFPYYWPDHQDWMLYYSPDFSMNNTSAAGKYQVLSDPGQAYRYVWNISSLIGAAPTMRVRIHNNGEGLTKPLIVRIKR